MRRKRTLFLLALSYALGVTSNLLADGPTFTQIDFPGAASTQVWGMNASGDIVGAFGSADNSTHVALKNNINTARLRITAASELFKGFHPKTLQ